MPITITFNSFLTALRWKLHSEMNIKVAEASCAKLRVNLTKSKRCKVDIKTQFLFFFIIIKKANNS